MKNAKRQRAIFVAHSTLIVSSILIAAGFLAGRIASLDLINFFLPFLLCAGSIAAIALFALRRLSMVLLIGATVMATRAGLLLISTPTISISSFSSTQPLKLVQLNAFKDNNTPEAVVNWVRLVHPDVIAMEEVLGSDNPILHALLAEYPYQVSCLPHMRCSTVILSRKKPNRSGGLAHGDPENQQALSAVWAMFTRGGQSYTLVAVHMVRPWPWGRQEPGRRALVRFLKTIDRRNVIIAGDFNLPPWSAAMARQDRLFGIPRYTNLPTWPAMMEGVSVMPMLPIDHVYAGPRWRIRSITRGPRVGSDHFPLSLSLEDADTPEQMSSIRR